MSQHEYRFLNAVVQQIAQTLPPLAGLFTDFTHPPGHDIDEASVPIFDGIDSGIIAISRDEFKSLLELSKLRAIEILSVGVPTASSYMNVSMATALLMYTANGKFFRLINLFLRESNRRLLKPFVLFIWLFECGLLCVAKFDGTSVFRGINGTYLIILLILNKINITNVY